MLPVSLSMLRVQYDTPIVTEMIITNAARSLHDGVSISVRLYTIH
jgi:hypothetical protein